MAANKTEGVSSSLQLACEFFESDADERLYAAVANASATKLQTFLELYRDFAAGSRLKAPPLESGSLRPYLRTDLFRRAAPWLWGSFRLGPGALANEGAVWSIVDTVKHRLLYCHSIALDDPLGYFVMRAASPSDIFPEIDAENRSELLNFIQLLIHFRPLIERNIVCFVSWDMYLERKRRVTPFEFLFRQFSKDSERIPPPVIDEYRRRAPQHVREHWDSQASSQEWLFQTLTSAAIHRIDETVSLLADAPDRFSPYFPFRHDIRLLKAFEDQIRFAVPDRENRLLTELIDIDLPGVASLTPDDIVAIRQGDAFGEWRNDLKEGLRRASSLPPDLLDMDRAARDVVAETLKPAYDKLQREFARSPLLTNARAASTTLMSGALGGLAGYLVEPSVGGLVGAVAGGFGQAACEFLNRWTEARKTTPQGARAATLSHYVALLS